MPSLLWQLHHSEDGSRLELPPPPPQSKSATPSPKSSRAQETQHAQAPDPALGSSDSPRNAKNQHQQQQQGVCSSSSSIAQEQGVCSSSQDLPSLESAFQSFLSSHPSFAATSAVDETRESEYPHLRSACFDYCGFGLFSYTQRFQMGAARSGFVAVPAASSGGLHAQAAYASTEPGTLQSELRLKVLHYLNVADGYSLVFTASKRAAFNLVADCYDFRARSKLLTVYDHESESIKLLVGAAKKSGAKISAARFRWPMLRICGDELAAALKSRSKSRSRKTKSSSSGKNKGLFVFPTQSRITGTKYSYQWMTLAEKNRWDVLLDVSAMGPRDMGSLGLSLFRPDFIICSFYKIFGADPTGFGCLLIKNTSLSSLRASSSSSAAAGSSSIGLVRLLPETRDDGDDDDDDDESSAAAAAVGSVPADLEGPLQKPMIAFSGPVTDQPVSMVSEADAAAFHEAILASAAAEEDQDQDHQHEDEEEHHHGNGNGDAHGDHLEKYHHREEQEEQEQSECEIQEVNDRASSSSASSLVHREDPSSYAHDDGGDQLRALPNGDAHHDDDSIFRRIGRDEGLIDSRRSDKFSRFLPIREDEEDDGQEPLQQMPSGGICRNRDDLANSGSWRNSSSSWRNNSSSWDAEGDYYYDDEELGSEDWDDEDEVQQQQQQQQQRENQPLIVCRGLDHANSMGLNKTNCRIKSLMDWLITSLASLFHHIPPSASTSTSKKSRRRPLVQIFGPKAQIDRGPAVAFNLYDQKGALIQPAIVQKLADRSSISLGCGCLSNLYLEEVCVTSGSGSDKETNPSNPTSAAKPTSSNPATSTSKRKKSRLPEKCSNVFMDHSGSGAHGNMKRLSNLPVLTATLGLVSNFEDVYRLWAFAAKFLEPDFVTGELLRYQSLNQETVIIGGDEIKVAS